VEHQVSTTTFMTATVEPFAVALIYYDDRQGLKNRGIKLDGKKSSGLPNPFPGDRGCVPPTGWQG